MGFFDGANDVDPEGKTPKFPPDANIVFRVSGIRVHQGQWGMRYIVEGEVLSSDSSDAPSGSVMSWTPRIDGAYKAIGLGEVKAFIAATLGIPPTDVAAVNARVTEATMYQTLSDKEDILRGRVVRTQTSSKDTKQGHEMTKHAWFVMDATEAAMLVSTAGPLPSLSPAQGGAPAAAFPPPGWTAHPSAPGHYYKGTEVKTEEQLKALVAPPPPPVAAPVPPPPAAPPIPPAAAQSPVMAPPPGAVPAPPPMMAPPVMAPPPGAVPAPPPMMAPPVMAPPPMPTAPPPQFPPTGWTAHPSAPGFFYRGSEVKSEAELRAGG